MVKARRTLAPILEADRTMGCERDGAGGSRLTSGDIISGGKAYGIPGIAGGEPWERVPPVHHRFRGHADVLGGTARHCTAAGGAAPAATLHVYSLQPVTL